MVSATVAPHAGSVDRNGKMLSRCWAGKTSLPTRGAWIEIADAMVALLSAARSLPTRGAWIEILYAPMDPPYSVVAPHAGSVDRNV